MISRNIRRVTAALATALVGIAMLSTAASAWEAGAASQPPQLEAGAKGYFVWHNGNGWHLRTHNDEDGVVYHGVLRTNGVFRDVHLVRAEASEDLRIEDRGHTLRFRFRTYAGMDGLDFKVDGGSYVQFDLETNGHQTRLDNIYIGAAGRHPGHNPFVIRR